MTECFNKFLELKVNDGLALNDVITEIYDVLIKYILNPEDKNELYKIIKNLNEEQVINILDKMRQIEVNNSVNTIENIQISGFIAVFKTFLST